MDTYADDLAALVEALGLKGAIHVGHSTGGGEVARYIGRHGTKRVAAAVLISAVPPLMVKTAATPDGIPIEVFEDIRKGLLNDRGQYYKEFAIPFYGINRDGSKVSQGVRDSFWLQSMLGGLQPHFECVKAFSETDFHEDLKKFDVPTLVLHAEDDQIVPIDISGRKTAKLVKDATFVVIEKADHGMCVTHKDRINQELLKFFTEKVGTGEGAERRQPAAAGR
jgi:non-heme chloroperoxidase